MQDYRVDKSLRATIGIVILVVSLLVILGGLFYHQVIKQEEYQIQSESNRIRVQPIIPKRGVIYDRSYNVIGENMLSFTVSVVPFEVVKGVTYQRLADLLGMDTMTVIKRARANFVSNFMPSPIKRGLGIDIVSILEEQGDDYPGITYSAESVRRYETGMSAESFIGYVGEASEDEIESDPDKGYRPGSLIGKKGIEKSYDRLLRGIEGTDYIEVSAKGKIIGPYQGKERIPAVPGSDLSLTIDIDLQKYIVDNFDTNYCCGAVVCIDPRNGEILAMVSAPELDPNIFSRPIPSDLWESIITDSTHPLLNRPMAGLYPPGSTTKLLTAGAALESNKITENVLLRPCLGGMRFGNRTFKCWNLGGHGRLDVYGAIEQSCDIYFYQVGQLLGVETFYNYAVKSGFGHKTGVDIIGEFDGIAPNSEYLDKLYGVKKWSPLLILNMAIGQGEFTVTPLQLAQFFCGLANNGVVYRPHFLREIHNPDGTAVRIAPRPSFNLPFSQKNLKILNDALELVVQGEHGTARGRRQKAYKISGKTGTAQNPHGNEHAWFVAFAPSDNPKIVCAAIVENGGHGSETAAPLVGRIIHHYLSNNFPEIVKVKEPVKPKVIKPISPPDSVEVN